MDAEAIAAKRAEIAARVAAARAQQDGGTSGGSSSGNRGGKKALSKKAQTKKALEEHTMPSAETLRRQAREMIRNPSLVRRANPEMRNLTDAQIREHAKEMEKIAANPEMMDAAMRLQSLPESDKSAITRFQEGVAGKVPRDAEWIAEMIRLVKGQPDTVKMLFKGRVPPESPISEGRLLGIVDYVVTCSDWFLTSVFHAIEWGNRMRGPAAAAYRMLDSATMGCAQYLVVMIVLLILFYVSRLIWYLVSLAVALVMSGLALLTGSATGSARDGDSTSAATPEPYYAEDETPFVEL
jgi:hypothetical protein